MMNEIYFRRKSKLLLKNGTSSESQTIYIATFLRNIQSLGFCLSQEILETLNTYTMEELESFYLELIPILKKSIGAHVKYTPMYPNFPEQVMEMNQAELYINAILHYYTYGYYFPETELKERLPLFENNKVKIIQLGTEEEFYSIFTNLMQSKTSISETDREDLAWFFKNTTDYGKYMPKEIPLKESIAYITKLILENAPVLSSKALYPYFKTATDVLRLITALSNGDISLSQNTKFRSFRRAERRLLLDLLENCKFIESDMKRYKERWIRIGERLHPSEYKGYETVKKAFDKLRNGGYIYSFGGSVVKAVNEMDYDKALAILSKRPGELARKLDYLLRLYSFISINESYKVISAFEKIASDVESTVLLQVREHFKNRGENQPSIRVFFPKGTISKAQCIENTLEPLSQELCNSVIYICEKALIEKYSAKEALGKVYINPQLENYLVPFSQRSASKAFKTIVRGSRLPLSENANTIRTFLWWKNGLGRTDLDLSAMLYDKNWNYKEHISFTNLKSKKYMACHSGDIVDAPRGASEFIDVEIESLSKYGCKYLVFTVLSYTGQKFCDLPECFVGFMERKKPKSGEIYEPKTVTTKMDITVDAQLCIPVIFDVEKREFIWTDLAARRNTNFYNTVEANQNSIIYACRSMVEIKKPNLYDLIQLHIKARGEACETKEEADIVFDIEEGITPFDLDVIAANYI